MTNEDALLLASVKRPHKKLLIKYLLPFFLTLILVVIGIVVAIMFRDKLNLGKHWVGALYAIFIPLGILFSSAGLIIRFYTLRYQIDDQGIRQSSGLIFRSENSLTLARVQDIHLTQDLIDRFIGLGNVAIQTASGQSTPEVTLYGLSNSTEIRDALYRRLRSIQGLHHGQPINKPAAAGAEAPIAPGTIVPLGVTAGGSDEVTELLRQIARETAMLSESIARMDPSRPERG